MIRELSNFVESIDPDYFTADINPAPGLHIEFEINENNEVVKESYKSFAFNKKGECFEVDEKGKEIIVECNEDFAKREYFSGFVTINKAVDFSRKLHSTSPYILWFKKDAMNLVEGRLDDYFKKTTEYVDDAEIQLVENIASFTKTELLTLIGNDNKFNSIKGSDYVKIYFGVPLKFIKTSYNNYLKERIYVKDDYNIRIDENEQVFGLSGFLNGANAKKDL